MSQVVGKNRKELLAMAKGHGEEKKGLLYLFPIESYYFFSLLMLLVLIICVVLLNFVVAVPGSGVPGEVKEESSFSPSRVKYDYNSILYVRFVVKVERKVLIQCHLFRVEDMHKSGTSGRLNAGKP